METPRRDFVKGAAGMAGILASGMAPSLYAAGANERIRVACVGYSDRFRGSLLPCFIHHNRELNFDLVAVADLWKKRLVEKAVPDLVKMLGHKVEAFSSDVDLYARGKDIDAVIISTADFQHAQHAVALIMSNAALRTGMKATFDEKARQVLAGGRPWTGYKYIHGSGDAV